MSKGFFLSSLLPSADGTVTPKASHKSNEPERIQNMKSSLALLARRAAVVASRRGVASPAVATTFVRAAAFSTQAAHDFESNMVSVE